MPCPYNVVLHPIENRCKIRKKAIARSHRNPVSLRNRVSKSLRSS
ncbi:hypothetical protein [Microseira wollei]|nr:hypothetical protein [Microseira wollei]